jgi:hypothetical protein
VNPFEQLLNTLNAPKGLQLPFKVLGALPELNSLIPTASLFNAFTGSSLNLNDLNDTGSATIKPLAGGMNLSFGNGFGLDLNARNKEIGIQTPVGALSGNFSKDNPGAQVAFPLGQTADASAGYDRAQGAFGKINFNIPFGGNQQFPSGRLPIAPLPSGQPSEVTRPPSTGRFLSGNIPIHLLPRGVSSDPDQEFLESYINKRL